MQTDSVKELFCRMNTFMFDSKLYLADNTSLLLLKHNFKCRIFTYSGVFLNCGIATFTKNNSLTFWKIPLFSFMPRV